MRTRRVGSITCGSLLIVFGMLFFVHMIFPSLSLVIIMKLWPVILIALGIEMLVANIRQSTWEKEILKYDKGAIIITFLLICFSMGMGILQMGMEYYVQHGYVYLS